MTNFLRNGKVFRPNDETSMQVEDFLPAANYVINRDQHGNFFFEMVESFPEPKKFYGNTIKNTKRILNTFLDRKGSTGILLAGEKGSGKTLLAKNIANQAAREHGIPTIIINAPWSGDSFNKFIQDITQPCVILFDEFEKVYDNDSQERMLTLLDGVFPSRKLFVLTCNNRWRIDEHMKNRPGRIYYMLDFQGLDPSFVEEYCHDNLNDKSLIKKVVTLSTFFEKFNFDMMKAIVEEMNRYQEGPDEVVKLLNTKLEYTSRATYDVKLTKNGVELKADRYWQGTPVSQVVSIDYRPNMVTDTLAEKMSVLGNATKWLISPSDPQPVTDDDIEWDDEGFSDDEYTISFKPTDIVSINPTLNTTTLRSGEFELVLTRQVSKTYDVFSSAAF